MTMGLVAQPTLDPRPSIYIGCGDGVRVLAADLSTSRVVAAGSKCEAIAVSPDTTLIACAGYESPLAIWRTDGELLRRHADETLVACVEFSPDGTLLAAGDQANACKLWSVADGSLVRRVEQTNTIRDVAWAPDGASFATICADGPAVIWNLDGSVRHPIKRGGVGHRLAYSASGKWLAACDTKGNTAVYDTATGKQRVKLKGKQGWSLSFLDEDTLLTSGVSLDRWELTTGTATSIYTGKVGLDIARVGDRIAGFHLESVIVLDLTGKVVVPLTRVIESYVKSIALA